MTLSKPQCLCCSSSKVRLRYSKVYHPRMTDHGPFDLFNCGSCGSLFTFPVPKIDEISSFYEKLQDGMPIELRNARESSPQNGIYKSYMKIVSRLVDSEDFSWLEIGSGGGEFAEILSEAKPKTEGLCLDFHSRPESLTNKNVSWNQLDLNKELENIVESFDLVVSFAVLEHVQDPINFVSNIVRLIKSKGKGLIVCPNYSSFASRILGRTWPYFSPGEHLTIPSLKGASCLMYNHVNCDFKVLPINMPYSIKYMTEVLGQKKISSMIPPDWTLPFPTGALSIEIYKK